MATLRLPRERRATAVPPPRDRRATAARAPQVTKESFYWALSVARSRAFSGPFAGGSFTGAVKQIGFAAALGALYVGTGVGGEEPPWPSRDRT